MSEAPNGATDVRVALDMPKLEAWMKKHVAGYRGPLGTPKQFANGAGARTCRLKDSSADAGDSLLFFIPLCFRSKQPHILPHVFHDREQVRASEEAAGRGHLEDGAPGRPRVPRDGRAAGHQRAGAQGSRL